MESGQNGLMQTQPQILSRNIPLVHPAEGGPGHKNSWAAVSANGVRVVSDGRK
jgi:hypothetical protein